MFHGKHFENGPGEAMYSQILIINVQISHENIYQSYNLFVLC